MVLYYAKALTLWAVSAAVWVLSQTDLVSSLAGGALTVAGMGVLIWKLVVDHAKESKIADEYEHIIEVLAKECDRLREENRRLRGER